LAAQVQKEEDNPDPDAQKDPNSGGDKALNEVFQKLYAGATDDRACLPMYTNSFDQTN
jgi:suppressor of G2 allele of SKP1